MQHLPQTALFAQACECRSHTTDGRVAGAEVPPEELVALVVALRDHLLASAAGGPLGAAPAGEPLSKPAGRRGGKRRGHASAAAASEPVGDTAVRASSRHTITHVSQETPVTLRPGAPIWERKLAVQQHLASKCMCAHVTCS